MKELKQAVVLLAFGPDTTCQPYKVRRQTPVLFLHPNLMFDLFPQKAFL